ncbi:MAG: DUF6624 domain-containing protein [Chitinophagales bacterium]
MLRTALLLLFLIKACLLTAQTSIDTAAIKQQLAIIRDRDQKTRTGRDSVAFRDYIDSTNLVQIEELISRYGWLNRSFVGPEGNITCFMVIQHSDSATQEKYFPLLLQSVQQGESSPSNLALLTDRILLHQGKKQMFGSQVVPDKNGNNVFYPIDDEKNVNTRRANFGMQPIEDYAKLFGINYIPPE